MKYKSVREFLLKNEFKKVDEHTYGNSMCKVILKEDHYMVTDNEGDTMYSQNVNIYWLIGYLTWSGYMCKNYRHI